MREIKFRGKIAFGGYNGGDGWIYGNLTGSPTHPYIQEVKDLGNDWYHLPRTEVVPKSVGQFTGLHDKNGKEIYEGDIIRRMYEMEVGKGRNRHIESGHVANDTPKVIDFRDGAFGYVNFSEETYQYEEWLPLLDGLCEVIGNVHDNPELLKGDEK